MATRTDRRIPSKQDRGHGLPATRLAAEPPSATLSARIERSYETMPPSEQLVADLLLDFPGRLATHSATEIASLARSSQAAVTRCIRRLGYRDFAQAKREAREAQRWGSPLYLDADSAERVASRGSSRPGRRPGAGGERRAALDAHFAADAQLLVRTREALSDADLAAAAQSIASARRVVVLGYRNSHVLAAYARSQIDLLRAGVELAPRAGETLAEVLVGLGPQDVVIAIGFRRRVPSFVHALRVAHQSGARTLLVTDPGGALGSQPATWTLSCHCRGASLFDSYVAAMSVLNYLGALVASLLGESARKRLQQAERLHRELGELV
jgi:DNA-binding MurR/RpiR family transcriptional regulator